MAPNLFVIAGPNGAGKSEFSNFLVQIEQVVFDGDKYISQLNRNILKPVVIFCNNT